jgi:hypothetical protein
MSPDASDTCTAPRPRACRCTVGSAAHSPLSERWHGQKQTLMPLLTGKHAGSRMRTTHRPPGANYPQCRENGKCPYDLRAASARVPLILGLWHQFPRCTWMTVVAISTAPTARTGGGRQELSAPQQQTRRARRPLPTPARRNPARGADLVNALECHLAVLRVASWHARLWVGVLGGTNPPHPLERLEPPTNPAVRRKSPKVTG